MKLVYLGTPEMAVPPLRALHADGHEILLVVSGPDRRRGRRGSATPSPVKAAALELGLEVTDDPDDLLGRGAELGVVVAYGRLLRPHLLAELDMVNLHFSLLPRWRGAAPVQRAILAGDQTTGVCVMKVDEGLDTGCVYDRVQVPVPADATTTTLGEQLVQVGTEALVQAVRRGLGPCTPQDDDGVTYAAKLTVDDLRLDWSRASVELDRVVRVGGAWTTWRGERLKVHRVRRVDDAIVDTPSAVPPGTLHGDRHHVLVQTGDGPLELLEVQPAGRSPMAAGQWCNGAHPLGDRLGADAAP